MSTTVTTTLRATLVEPTAHKARKIKTLVTTYREALHEAFDSGVSTMSAVNDIVTPYDLPYQAKDAIKNHVPQLRSSLDAKSLDDGQPLRLTNRAAKFDRDSSRRHEICWRVPQAGRGNAFWIPLCINPDQEELWHQVMNDEISIGQVRLQESRKGWTLDLIIERVVDGSQRHETESSTPTYVGIDVGESALITGCALKHDKPTKPFVWSGGRASALRKEMHTTLKRLKQRDAADWRIKERSEYLQNALTDIIEKTSRHVVEYASQFNQPVIVLENLKNITEDQNYGRYMNRRLHSWAFARIQTRIEDKATIDSIPVVHVDPAYTSKICHTCHQVGARPEQATFVCDNEHCPVTEFQADINAAANIARRADPWGETCRMKYDGDDSPWDGSASDSATEHHE